MNPKRNGRRDNLWVYVFVTLANTMTRSGWEYAGRSKPLAETARYLSNLSVRDNT